MQASSHLPVSAENLHPAIENAARQGSGCLPDDDQGHGSRRRRDGPLPAARLHRQQRRAQARPRKPPMSEDLSPSGLQWGTAGLARHDKLRTAGEPKVGRQEGLTCEWCGRQVQSNSIPCSLLRVPDLRSMADATDDRVRPREIRTLDAQKRRRNGLLSNYEPLSGGPHCGKGNGSRSLRWK